MRYLVQRIADTFCPDCDRQVYLLFEGSADWPAPQFYICFRCRYVGYIGNARLDVPEPDVIVHNPEHVDRGWLMAFVADVSAKLTTLRSPMTHDMASVALARASFIARKLALKER